MNFLVFDASGEVKCNIIMTFRDDSNDINYIIYTDGTNDESGELELYASRYTLRENNYYLEDIENEYEWDLIDNMLDSINKENINGKN